MIKLKHNVLKLINRTTSSENENFHVLSIDVNAPNYLSDHLTLRNVQFSRITRQSTQSLL